MNWLLIAVLVFMLISTINGYRKGFIKLAVSFLFVIIAIFMVKLATPYVGHFLEHYTPIYKNVKEQCIEIFREDAGEFDAQKRTDQVQAIENSRLPKGMKNALLENNNSEIYRILGVEAFEDYIGTYIAKMIINILAFLITFILIYFILKIVVVSLDIIAHLPVLHGMNKMAGLVLGFVESIIFIWIFFLVLTMFFTGNWGVALLEMINESFLLSFLYQNNYLMLIIMMIVLGL